MGFTIAASCKCGYKTEFRVGGTRSGFLTTSYFPHYCESCGLVSVNVARARPEPTPKEKLLSFTGIKEEVVEEPLCCPQCQSQDIKIYGKEPMVDVNRCRSTISWGNDYLDDLYNFCPSCKQYTMRSDIASFLD
jgi:hypothetical protein